MYTHIKFQGKRGTIFSHKEAWYPDYSAPAIPTPRVQSPIQTFVRPIIGKVSARFAMVTVLNCLMSHDCLVYVPWNWTGHQTTFRRSWRPLIWERDQLAIQSVPD